MRNIVITGGGTGGHLAVANAFKNECNLLDIEPLYIGSENGQERDWFVDDSGFIDKIFFNTHGVVNKKGIKKLTSLYEILKNGKLAKELFEKHNIDKVISVGGYSAAPAALATVSSNQKLYIHEQNAHVGSLNRLLKPFAKYFYSSYHESPVMDYPIDRTFFDRYRHRKDIKTIIFLGGSQGAVAINNIALNLAKELLSRDIKIIHQCGKYDYDRVSMEYKKSSLDVELIDFSKNIIDIMDRADFAIARAGASTVWELTALGLPALFIPYPYAAGDHQYYNAKFLYDKKLAYVSRESSFEQRLLFDLLERDVSQMSSGLKEMIKPDGAKRIVEHILND